MPNSEGYVKCGESTLITTTGRVFSLHHSATIIYDFDKIFIPNALDMTLLSNDVKLYANDCTFLKLSVVEREIHNIVLVKFHVWWRKTSNSPHFISTSISVCNAQSFADDLSKSHNLKASPFRAIGVLNDTIIEKWIWLTAAEKNEWTCWMIGHCIQRLTWK